MDTNSTVSQLNDAYTIRVSAQETDISSAQIQEMPIHTSSTKQITGRWWHGTKPLPPSDLTMGEGGFLQGKVVNPLDVEIKRCLLFHDNWVYRIASKLQPGESAGVESTSPVDLRWHLARHRMGESNVLGTPWDRTDFDDLPRVMEMMMFHEAAGGHRYTQLFHRYQATVELSDHVRNGRAILVCSMESPSSRLRVDGRELTGDETRRWTYCRIVLPVKETVSR